MELDESQQLNNPAMQLLAAGRGFTGDMELSPGTVPTNPDKINIIRLPKAIRLTILGAGVNAMQLSGAHVGTMRDRLLTPAVSGGAGRVTISEEKWTTNDANGQPSASTYSAIEAFQQARYVVNGGFAVRQGDAPVNVSAV
jgi:hypothetical protein